MRHTTQHFKWVEYDAYCQSMLRKSPLYAELLDSSGLRRLSGIRFLGALDLLKREHWVSVTSPNRFDHSVGVAYLALKASKLAAIPLSEEHPFVCAALLHDVGHGALSHSVEQFFDAHYNFNHKDVTKRVILGDIPLGRDIANILKQHNVSPSKIIDILSDLECGRLQHLIGCPINIDTIDGITRTISYFNPAAKQPPPDETLKVAMFPSTQTEYLGDAFWQRKEQAYNSYINRPEWAALDDLVTMALRNSTSVVPDDFLLSDAAFYSKYGKELERLKNVRRQSAQTSRVRHFLINRNVRLERVADLYERYIEVDDKHEAFSTTSKHSYSRRIHQPAAHRDQRPVKRV